MKQLLKNISSKSVLAVALMMGFVAMPLAAPVSAVDGASCTMNSISGGANCAKGDDQTDALFGDTGIFKTITNTLLFIVGAIAVIMLIIGGVRYTISGGDSKQVESAKNTIMYAIIGIIVVILAYAVVNFVIDALVKPTS